MSTSDVIRPALASPLGKEGRDLLPSAEIGQNPDADLENSWIWFQTWI